MTQTSRASTKNHQIQQRPSQRSEDCKFRTPCTKLPIMRCKASPGNVIVISRDRYFKNGTFISWDRYFENGTVISDMGPLFQEQLHWTVISRTMVEVTQNDDGLPASQRREKRAESAAEREHTQTMVNGRLDVCPSFVRR
jgi:hypothetical protein